MTDSIAKPGRRGRGRPQVEKHTGHTIWCTEAGWAWLLEQSTGKGHKSVGKWADALGRSPIMAISQARRREYGQPTTFERDPDGGYAWSVAAVQERHGFRTTAEFAEAFGVSPRTVESWRAGRPPSRLALEKLRHWATRTDDPRQAREASPEQEPATPASSEWAAFLQMNSEPTPPHSHERTNRDSEANGTGAIGARHAATRSISADGTGIQDVYAHVSKAIGGAMPSESFAWDTGEPAA